MYVRTNPLMYFLPHKRKYILVQKFVQWLLIHRLCFTISTCSTAIETASSNSLAVIWQFLWMLLSLQNLYTKTIDKYSTISNYL